MSRPDQLKPGPLRQVIDDGPGTGRSLPPVLTTEDLANPPVEVLVFGAAAAGLVRTGNLALALAFMAVAVINALLMFAWGQ